MWFCILESSYLARSIFCESFSVLVIIKYPCKVCITHIRRQEIKLLKLRPFFYIGTEGQVLLQHFNFSIHIGKPTFHSFCKAFLFIKMSSPPLYFTVAVSVGIGYSAQNDFWMKILNSRCNRCNSSSSLSLERRLMQCSDNKNLLLR